MTAFSSSILFSACALIFSMNALPIAPAAHAADLVPGSGITYKPSLYPEHAHFGGVSGAGSVWTFKSSANLTWICAGNRSCRLVSDTIKVPANFTICYIKPLSFTGGARSALYVDIQTSKTAIGYSGQWGNNDRMVLEAEFGLTPSNGNETCMHDGHVLTCTSGKCTTYQ